MHVMVRRSTTDVRVDRYISPMWPLVHEGNGVDLIARLRGNSVSFPRHAAGIPSCAGALTGRVSLRADEDRLVLSA